MFRFRLRLLPFCFLLAAHGSLADALPEDDLVPLTGGFGLPGIRQGGGTAEAGHWEMDTSFLIASHAIIEESAGERLILDGETSRLSVTLSYGVTNRLELGIDLPWVSHESGNLDRVIDTWHDIFGLPDGARDDLPRDQLRFLYVDSNSARVDFRRNSNGQGDVSLFAAMALGSDARHQKALRLGIKLPTGDAARFLGSGGTDVSLGLAGDISQFGGRAGLAAFYRAGLAWLSAPDWLEARHRSVVGQLTGGIDLALDDRYRLAVQGTLRTAAYDSTIDILGEPALTLTFGGHVRLRPGLELSLAVSEDIKVSSAPDVTFNIALRYRPD